MKGFGYAEKQRFFRFHDDMKIVFWNIKQNKNRQLIIDLVARIEPDIFFLAECPESLVETFGCRFQALKARVNDTPKVRGFVASNAMKCRLIQEISDRFFVYHVLWEDKEVFLGVVHLLSKLYADTGAQKSEVQKYMWEIRSLEKERNSKNTILIGDFNMNPFDPGMVYPHAFNSVCSKMIAAKKSRTYERVVYDYFYNPSWTNYAGLGNEIYGTYYHRCCRPGGFHWNNFDQALLRPDVLENFDCRFSVLHNLFDYDLHKQNKDFSDHYPILLELKEK